MRDAGSEHTKPLMGGNVIIGWDTLVPATLFLTLNMLIIN